MKTPWVATHNAGKTIGDFIIEMNWRKLFLIALSGVCSCSNDDDEFTPIMDIEEEPIIIYTDIDPDFSSEDFGDEFLLDLNNDQVTDFILSRDKYDHEGSLWINSNPDNENGVYSISPWYAHPIPLENGRKIFGRQNFENWGLFDIGGCYSGDTKCVSDWKDKGEKYLGLKINIMGEIYFGWARMEIQDAGHWILKDYAYNAMPDKPINAGEY